MVYEHAVDPPQADDPDAIREFTQRCTDVLEMYVRRYPGPVAVDAPPLARRRARADGRGMFPAATSEEDDDAANQDGRRMDLRAWPASRACVAVDRARAELARRRRDGAAGAGGRPPRVRRADDRRSRRCRRSRRSSRSRPAPRPTRSSSIDRAREAAQLQARAGRRRSCCCPTRSAARGGASRSGVAERWGYRAAGRGWLLTRGVRAAARRACTRSQYYLALVRGLGLPTRRPTPTPRPRIDPRRGDARAGRRAAGAARRRRRARRSSASPRAPPTATRSGGRRIAWRRSSPALVAAAASRAVHGRRRRRPRHGACDRIVAAAGRARGEPDRPHHAARSWSGSIARCAAFVSNDSGAMHLAAALGVPLTAIFGPTDERVTAPARRRGPSSCATCSAARACCASVRSITAA